MQPPVTAGPSGPPKVEAPDVLEYGAAKDGVRQSTNRRLFMQLLVYTGCTNPRKLLEALKAAKIESVVYLNVNDSQGVGILLMSEDPSHFTGRVREVLNNKPFSKLTAIPEMTMIGRTYALGHEQDLEDWLLQKSRRNVFNEKLQWAVWYPLRRKGEFESLTKDEQRGTLMEHAKLGMSYGQADLAYDVRLACFGIDRNDNEFVLGVVAYELSTISRLVQDMRKTQQTSKYIQSMGPFFVGKVFGAVSSAG